MPDNDAHAARPCILLTRPRAQATRFAERLAQIPAIASVRPEVIVSPLMAVVGHPPPTQWPDGAAAIFTSQNGVAFAGPGEGRKAWCVGQRTTVIAREAGFEAQCGGADADALVATLLEERPTAPVLHLHGTHLRGDVVARLRQGGLRAAGHLAYAQTALAPDACFAEALDKPRVIVPLFSPRSAQLFADAAGPPRPGAWIIALSQAVLSTLPPTWQSVTSKAHAPDADAMIAALARRITP